MFSVQQEKTPAETYQSPSTQLSILKDIFSLLAVSPYLHRLAIYNLIHAPTPELYSLPEFYAVVSRLTSFHLGVMYFHGLPNRIVHGITHCPHVFASQLRLWLSP